MGTVSVHQLPKSTESIFKKVNVGTIRQDTKVVVFSCLTNIRYLCTSEQIFLDGTFSYCAQHFLQLFIIHTLENGR